MTDSEIADHAKEIINLQLLAIALALATKDRDDQIPYLANLIDSTAREAGDALAKAFEEHKDYLNARNLMLAECVEHAERIKKMATGLARAAQEDRDDD